MLIQSPESAAANKQNKSLSFAESGKVQQNPQPPRNNNQANGEGDG
jgi:hypothetical protein